MAKESTIRRHAHDTLVADGWVCWWAPHVRYRQEQDIFGVYDAVCAKPGEFPRFIQITSKSNISARKKKVLSFLTRTGVEVWSEVWGYDASTRSFKVVEVK